MRTLLWILGIPLLLIVLAALLLPLLIDEDTIVALAAGQIETRSGVELTVEGDASLSLFPTLGVSMNGVRAVLPEESGTVEARSLATGVSLMPLLRGKVEIDSLRLEGVTLTTVAANEAAAKAAAMDTSRMSRAELDTYYALRREARERGAAEAAMGSLSVGLALEVGELTLRDIRAVTVDSQGEVISEVLLEELIASDLNIDGRSIPLTAKVVVPGEGDADPLELLLDAGIAADLDADTVVLESLSVRVTGATPAPLELQASGNVTLSTQVADLDLELQSDGLNGAGSLRYAAFESPQIDATLALTELTPALLVLAGPEAATAGDDTGTQANGETPLPLDALRMIDTRAALSIDRVALDAHELTDVEATLRVLDGVATLDPVNAQLHGGDIDFQLVLDGHYNAVSLATGGGVDGLDVGRAVAATEAGVSARGTATLTWDLQGSGTTVEALTSTLTGPITLATDDISIEGIALERMMCRGVALVNQEPLSADFPADTRFEDLSADIRLENGVARLDPLTAQLSAVSLTGNGTLDIESGDLRASLRAQLSEALGELDPACRINERYTQLRWPVECEGNLAGDPAEWCGVSTTEIVRDLAEGELKRKAGEEAGKLLKKIFDRD